jgi:hypothetical protein
MTMRCALETASWLDILGVFEFGGPSSAISLPRGQRKERGEREERVTISRTSQLLAAESKEVVALIRYVSLHSEAKAMPRLELLQTNLAVATMKLFGDKNAVRRAPQCIPCRGSRQLV